MRILLRIPVAAAVGAALLLGSTGTATAQTVTPVGYAAQVCAAVASAHQAIQATGASLTPRGAAYKSAPSPTTAAALRDAFIVEIQVLDQQMASVSTTVQQAGEPTGAPRFSAALLAQFAKEHATSQQLAQQAAAIDVSAPAAFETGIQQLLVDIKKAAADERASAKAEPALAHPIKALRPISRYMTTKAVTCTKS
jgi:hypothetical protein